jgi:hypothetical protein
VHYGIGWIQRELELQMVKMKSNHKSLEEQKVPLVLQYVRMMGAKSTHISDNNKLGRTNYGLWKFQLKYILIRNNAYHYMVLDPNRNVMDNPITIAQGQ